MRILLTGAAGFIAGKVAELLLADGHSVVGIDNMNDAYDPRLKEHRLAALRGREGFRFEQVDICDRPALESVWTRAAATTGTVGAASDAAGPAPVAPAGVTSGAGATSPEALTQSAAGPFDAVINLAARAGVHPSVDDPWVYVDTNMTGTLNLLDLCRRYGCPKFVLASTSSLYGAHNPQPFSEDQDTSRPLSPYAASKKGAEALCYTYHYLHGIDVTVFRYFTVYGPAGRPDLSLFRFCRWIHEGDPVLINGDGRQSRDFTHVADVARGTVLGLRPLGYEIINLGSDRPVELLRVVELLEKETGERADLRFGPPQAADVRATWADIHKARRLLGWEPEVDLDEGVRRLVAWYRDNRELARSLVI